MPRMLAPLHDALAGVDPTRSFEVLSVPSGYPAPKYVNLVLRRREGRAVLFETSSGESTALAGLVAELAERGVARLDAIAVTHSHGDHGGAANTLRHLGRNADDPAPVHAHSAGHRLNTNRRLEYLDEAFAILVARSHRGSDRFDESFVGEAFELYRREAYADRYERMPRSGYAFVDHGRLPDDVVALHTPGHSDDCVMYLDTKLGIAIPGDTVLTAGDPADPSTHRIAIPPFTVVQQRYSRAVDAFLDTLGRVRRFFEAYEVRLVIPPHGRLAVTAPLAWVDAAEAYFESLHAELARRIASVGDAAFGADAVLRGLSVPGATDQALTTHGVGLLCAYADEGYLDATESPRSRRLEFRFRSAPDTDFVRRRMRENLSPLQVFGARDVGAGR